jgi:Bacterial regulatory proteins, luxR family
VGPGPGAFGGVPFWWSAVHGAAVAERLHISIATVKAHTGNLFTKLALENRVQIALLVRDAEE